MTTLSPRRAADPRELAPPVIALEDVRKTYSNGSLSVEALRGIDLSIGER